MSRAKKTTENETPLLTALKFVSCAQQEIGNLYQTHCRFVQMNGQGYVVAFDGIMAAGHPIQEELAVCPHTLKLIAALERVKGAMSLTALDNKQLVIKTAKFRAAISCLGDGDLTYTWPDAPDYPLNDDFKKAADIASTYNTEAGQTVMQASIVTRNNSLVGTNGNAVIEAWHGLATPPDLIIPVTFVKAIQKVASPITRFGFSDSSFTVHFENGSWIKTQLYIERYPNVDSVLSKADISLVSPFNKDVVEAIKAVLPFSETSIVSFKPGRVQSHTVDEIGATYEAKSVLHEFNLNAKLLLPLVDFITQIDYASDKDIITFFGNNIRGAIAKAV